MAKTKINFKDIKILYKNFGEYYKNTQPYETPEHSWRLLPDAEKAVSKLMEYKNRNVLIVGDYDNDGLSATATIKIGLEYLGFSNVNFVIPKRMSEGYGLTDKLVERILQQKPDLIITVDNGIVAIEQIQNLIYKGIEVIVTDHHEPKPDGSLPPAYAVVDQKRLDSNYPYREICGAYIAYKIIEGCCEIENKEFPKEILLPFATSATVADVMPLLDENRTLVKDGIKLISENPNQIYRAFFNLFPRIKQHELKSSDFGFYFGPLINCNSRMLGETDDVMKIFLNYNNKEICDEYAAKLFSLNEQRKAVQNQQDKILDEALKEYYPNLASHKVPVVLAVEDLHKGIVGINASHISEQNSVPAFILSINKETGMASGSARSINNISALKLLENAQDILSYYGGHMSAAGLGLPIENIEKFRKSLIEYSDTNLSQDDFRIITDIACPLAQNDITLYNYQLVASREPYGQDNEEPLFIGTFPLTSYQFVGSGNTLKMSFGQDIRNTFDAIMFNVDEETKEIIENSVYYNIIFKLGHNVFRGTDKVQIQVEAIERL